MQSNHLYNFRDSCKTTKPWFGRHCNDKGLNKTYHIELVFLYSTDGRRQVYEMCCGNLFFFALISQDGQKIYKKCYLLIACLNYNYLNKLIFGIIWHHVQVIVLVRSTVARYGRIKASLTLYYSISPVEAGKDNPEEGVLYHL